MAVEEDLHGLRLIPLFQAFEPDALRLLAFGTEEQLLRAGDALFRRGETSDGGYILTSGSIALETHDDGRPPEKILQPFALIGEIALMAATTRPVTAIAREPAKVLKARRALFHQVLEQYPLTAARVRTFLSRQLKEFAKELKLDPVG
jgi:CRP-like cAMP-binding protein